MTTCRNASIAILCLLFQATHGAAAEAQSATAGSVQKTKVAVLVFPGVELLDFSGPGEVLAAARRADNAPLFDVYTVGIGKKPIKSTQFLTITPQYDPTDAPAPGIVVIPGGGVESAMNNAPLCEWIKRQAQADCLLFFHLQWRNDSGKARLPRRSASRHAPRQLRHFAVVGAEGLLPSGPQIRGQWEGGHGGRNILGN